MLKHLPIKKLILASGDALLVVISFYLCYSIRHGELIDVFYRYTGAAILSIFIFVFIFHIADAYNTEGKFYSINNIIKLVITIAIANSLIAIAFFLFHLGSYSRIVFLLNPFFIFGFLISWRFVFGMLSKYGEKPSRILIVGASWAGRELYSILDGNDNFEIIGYLDDEKEIGTTIGHSKVIGDTSLLQSLVKDKDIDEVVVAITHAKSPELFKRITDIKFKGVQIYDMPRFYEKISAKIPVSHVNYNWLCYSNFYDIRRDLYNLRIKNVLDKIVAVLIVIITFPLIIMSMLAIKLSSKGPVFFVQERVGEGIGNINIIKFRTMKLGMEEERELAGFRNDPRITRVGKILRFFRFDEIPQLWNVIKGDMSIVGPRALMKEEVSRFSKEIPYFCLRQFVKPGITGWAQVNYKHGTDAEDAIEKLQYDLFYINNLSPILDFHILLKTIKVVMFGRGAN